MGVSTATIKQLYSLSMNECAEPTCERRLVEIDPRTERAVNYGEIAHIHGRQPNAERYDAAIAADPATVDGFDNLLLLCGQHHTQIDQTGAAKHYTPTLLRHWKENHQLKALANEDREWVYGGNTVVFNVEDQQVTLPYWHATNGDVRLYTDAQLAQANAATDLSILFSQIGDMLSILDQASGEPHDPSHQTFNDSYIAMLKERAERLKQSLRGTAPDGGFDSGLHRLYHNLQEGEDITLAELAQVGSVERQRSTTIIVGPTTPDRIADAITPD